MMVMVVWKVAMNVIQQTVLEPTSLIHVGNNDNYTDERRWNTLQSSKNVNNNNNDSTIMCANNSVHNKTESVACRTVKHTGQYQNNNEHRIYTKIPSH